VVTSLAVKGLQKKLPPSRSKTVKNEMLSSLRRRFSPLIQDKFNKLARDPLFEDRSESPMLSAQWPGAHLCDIRAAIEKPKHPQRFLEKIDVT
jgi:hypothetical protein